MKFSHRKVRVPSPVRMNFEGLQFCNPLPCKDKNAAVLLSHIMPTQITPKLYHNMAID